MEGERDTAYLSTLKEMKKTDWRTTHRQILYMIHVIKKLTEHVCFLFDLICIFAFLEDHKFVTNFSGMYCYMLPSNTVN